MPRKDLDEIDLERLSVLSIRFNDSKLMTVDGEVIIGLARNVEQAKPVPDEQSASLTHSART